MKSGKTQYAKEENKGQIRRNEYPMKSAPFHPTKSGRVVTFDGVEVPPFTGNTNRAQSVEILAHLPDPAQTEHPSCSVRRYAMGPPLGRSANFFCLTRCGVTPCEFLLLYLPDGYAPHVSREIVGVS